ncbi:MAG: polysaccharide biosynthesis protein, partial [Nanoarchaeota archaeon]
TLNAHLSSPHTKFSCVRFGNVLNSRGSVIPLFVEQILKKQPITITHPDMDRFFISIQQAVNLVLEAARRSEGKEIFILKMQACKIKDLAEAIKEHYVETGVITAKDCPITTVGIRPGEKMSELLMTEEEAVVVEETDDMLIIRPRLEVPHLPVDLLVTNPETHNKNGIVNSRYAPHLTKAQIKSILKDTHII